MNLKSYIKLDRMDYYPKFSKGFLVDFFIENRAILAAKICENFEKGRILYLS